MNFMNLKILAALTMLLSAHGVRAEELEVNPNSANLLPEEASSSQTSASDSSTPSIYEFINPYSGALGPHFQQMEKMHLEKLNIGKFDRPWLPWDQLNFNNAQDAVEYQGPVCEEVSEVSLSKLAQDTNWSKCFEGRQSYATSANTSDKELLQKDLDVCSCLRNWSTLPAVGEAMKANVTSKRSKTVPQKELNDVLNGILFHTFVITNDTKTTELYANNLYSKKDDVKSQEKLTFEMDKRLVMDQVPYPDGQCISPREFILSKQRPNVDIIRELENSYDDGKWNYKKLYARYDEIMKLPLEKRLEVEVEIVALKEKLMFLNKNPLAKYAFAVDTKELPEAQRLKDAVYKSLQMLKTEECLDITSQCTKDYNASLTKIFTHEKVAPLIRKEARLDHEARVKRKLLNAVSEKKKREVTQRSIVSEFMDNFQLGNPDDCQSGTSKGIECIEIFSGYCKTLDKYSSDIAGLSTETSPSSFHLNDLDEQIKDDFNPDINTNEEFKKFNNMACNMARKKNTNGVFKSGLSHATFGQFVDNYCSKSSKRGCRKSSSEDYAVLRKAWAEEYPVETGMSRVIGRIHFGKDGSLVNSITKSSLLNGGTKEMTKSDVSKIGSEVNSSKDDTQIAFEMGQIANRGPDIVGSRVLAEMKEAEKAKAEGAKTPFMAGVGQAIANNMGSSLGDPTAPPIFDEIPQNFGRASAYSSSFSQAASTTEEVSKVEDMSEDKRRELLSDWQKDYDQWKKEKGSDLSPADRAQDSALRQEIATLRALLDQQKEMSEEQFKLLNDALAAKKVEQQQTLAKQEVPDAVKRAGSQFASASRVDGDMDNLRAPASIKEAKMNTAGAMGGGVSSAVSTKRSSQSSDSSNESVAREQAKLVNLRRYSDGTITIESAGAGASTQVNAITVPVSDEQYKMLQVNPTGLNLSQIERNIPKDQIAKLEKSGEIIILLRNGSNPPFEVKVAKKDNRLVYSLKDKDGKEQAPIRRVYTRQALELELKAQK